MRLGERGDLAAMPLAVVVPAGGADTANAAAVSGG